MTCPEWLGGKWCNILRLNLNQMVPQKKMFLTPHLSCNTYYFIITICNPASDMRSLLFSSINVLCQLSTKPMLFLFLFWKIQVSHSNGAKDKTRNILLYNHTVLPGIRFSQHKYTHSTCYHACDLQWSVFLFVGIVVPAASGEQAEKPKRVVYDNRKKKKTQRQQSTEGEHKPNWAGAQNALKVVNNPQYCNCLSNFLLFFSFKIIATSYLIYSLL